MGCRNYFGHRFTSRHVLLSSAVSLAFVANRKASSDRAVAGILLSTSSHEARHVTRPFCDFVVLLMWSEARNVAMGDVVIIWMVRSVSSRDDSQHELRTLDSLDARLPTSTYSGARQGTEWKVRGISPRGSCWRPVWHQSAIKEWSRIHPPSSSDSGALDSCRTSPNTDPLHVGHCFYNVLARNQAREHRDRSWWSGATS